MPFRKKALYYGVMLLLILLALEGMARVAYYLAYGPGDGSSPSEGLSDSGIPADSNADPEAWRLRHPFYGFTESRPRELGNELNAMPPQQRQANTVVVGLLGGSMADEARPFLQYALNGWFAAHNRPQQPLVLMLAIGGAKQPQQTLVLANALLLGGEFDLIVHLDGFNEIIFSAGWNPRDSVFPFFPTSWDKQVSLTGTEFLLAGRIGALRREQTRLAAARATSPLRWSAVFGLVNRYRQERINNEIILLNHQLAATAADYTLEKHGPEGWPPDGGVYPAAAEVWYRGALAMNRLAKVAGADYYHFLQPNQYAPGSKLLSPEELAKAYAADSLTRVFVEQGYPQLREFNHGLLDRGVNYFDLTGIFAGNRETLYRDECCHLTERGYELLAAAMVARMEPALRRLGPESPARPVSALEAARRPALPPTPPAAPDS